MSRIIHGLIKETLKAIEQKAVDDTLISNDTSTASTQSDEHYKINLKKCAGGQSLNSDPCTNNCFVWI